MPQLSLYIDKETLSRIETAAKIGKTSVSKWVSERLRESLANNWPKQYDELFGSIEDPSFAIEKDLSFSNDVKREQL